MQSTLSTAIEHIVATTERYGRAVSTTTLTLRGPVNEGEKIDKEG